MQLRVSLCLIVLLTGVSQGAGSEDATFPVVGGYGFNWLEPATAQCALIKQTDVQRFTACTYEGSGAFGLSLRFHTCAAPDAEFLIFSSPSECQEALETMQANAP